MGLRVHELAKELKISTSALKKHLKDIGVNVKSHMSTVEDEIANNIRNKFKEAVLAQQKMNESRKKFRRKKKMKKKKAPKPLNITKKTIDDVLSKLDAEAEKSSKEVNKKKVLKKKKIENKPKKKDVKQEVKKEVKIEEKKVKQKNKHKQNKKKTSQSSKKEETKKKTPPVSNDKNEKKKSEKTSKPNRKKPSIFKKKKTKKKKSGKIHARAKTYKPGEAEKSEIEKRIKQTLNKKKKKKYNKKKKKNENVDDNKLVVSEFTSVSELAKMMDVDPTVIVVNFMNMGQMVTINKRLDKESLELICDEMDFDVEFQEEYGKDVLEEKLSTEASDAEEVHRAPVVTIMGHVDHGKTSILDYIRESNIADGEAGKITQHIGAYQIKHNNKKITFIDTPGHEAFTAMRSRGANVTDIVVIVVAANDSVMPQTIEAIDHAKAANVPIIVAINKIDLPEADKDRTINDLLSKQVYLENYGGEVQWTTCSAKTGEGIDELLELILLQSEIEDLKAVKDVPGSGTVIESEKDPYVGNKVSILVQEGTVKKGDILVCGATYGKVRKLENEKGKELTGDLYPSDIAVVFGLKDVPQNGDKFNVLESEKEAKDIASERSQIRRERERFRTKTNLSNVFDKMKKENMEDLNIIIKGDTDGSVEALADSLLKITNEEININIIRKAVGGIKPTDVDLAAASDAIIIGFHVRANNQAAQLAVDEGVDIKIYNIIYDAIDDIKKAMEGMLSPEYKEVVLGAVEVKDTFKISRLGTVAGCQVTKGKVKNDSKVRIYRDDIMIYEGVINTLKRFQNDVKEVTVGKDCGILVEKFNDIKVGDVIEPYEIREVQRTL